MREISEEEGDEWGGGRLVGRREISEKEGD